MKLFSLLTALFVTVQVTAQNTEYIVSTGGIGPFKIGMSKPAVEKLLGSKITFPKNTKGQEGYDWDTLKCRYKELEMEMVFAKTYYGNDTTVKMGIYEIKCSSPTLKTKSGIAIGDDKLKIFKTYDQYRLEYFPDWDKKLNPKKSQVNLFDNEMPNVLIFYLYDGVVTGFGAMIYEGD